MSEINKVQFGQKIAFGFGMLANQMFPAVISIFIIVLVQNLGFPGWMWRSEERRVGKECRTRWSPDHIK